MNYFTACGICHQGRGDALRGSGAGGHLAARRRDRPSIVGAVFTALLLGAGPSGEPIAALRALPLDHSWKRLPGLGMDRASRRFFVGQLRPPLVSNGALAAQPAPCSQPFFAATAVPNRTSARSRRPRFNWVSLLLLPVRAASKELVRTFMHTLRSGHETPDVPSPCLTKVFRWRPSKVH
jgi:hypothetical protein